MRVTTPTRQQDATTLLTKLDDSKRIVARLMAQENISVQVVDGAPTASFDTTRRVLTIPNWDGLTVAQFDHLLGHEVGHALFTDRNWIETVIADQKAGGKSLKSYWNVVEDAYIERKMRAVFPGLTRIFYNSYDQFHKAGPLFKGTRTHIEVRGTMRAIKSMKLIDRINLFYKIGAFVDIPFNAEEREWVRRIDRCTGTQDALAIAKALRDFAKEQEQDDEPETGDGSTGEGEGESDSSEGKKQKKQKKSDKKNEDKKDKKKSDKQKQSSAGDEEDEDESSAGDKDADDDSDGDDSGDSDSDGDSAEGDEDSDSDASGDDSEDDEDSDGAGSSDADSDDDSDADEDSSSADGDADPDDDIAETDSDINDKLTELAREKKVAPPPHLLIGALSDADVKRSTESAHDYAAKVDVILNSFPADARATIDTLEASWKRVHGETAKHMAMEFERKKSAKAHERALLAKSGRLNMGKLHTYKFTEDLFQRTLTLPKGQSHGIVMLIDGSASMSSTFHNVCDQLLLFAEFAFTVKIPFEAYMFTDRLSNHFTAAGNSMLTPNGAVKLIGLVNTNTERRTFRKQTRAVLALRMAVRAAASYRNEGVPKPLHGHIGRIPHAQLGNTPLYGGMMLAERHVARMKRTLRLDKMLFVLLTDGGDTAHLKYTEPTIDYRGVQTIREAYLSDGQPVVVRDLLTKRNYVAANATGRDYVGVSNGVLDLLHDVIRTRHEARTIHMHLVANEMGLAGGTATVKHPSETLTVEARHEQGMKEYGFAFFPHGQGVADANVILAQNRLELTEDTTAAANVAALQKQLLQRVHNRKFVNMIIPFIA